MWDINADAACSLNSVKRKRKRIGSRSWSMEKGEKSMDRYFSLQIHRLCKYWSYI